MGCDIHLYIEYREPGNGNRWWNFGEEFRLGRNYCLFGLLAGVRQDTALVEPRGVPDDIGTRTHEGYWRRICYDGQPEERETTPEKAASWVGYGCRYKDEVHATVWKTTYPDGTTKSEVHNGAHDGKPYYVSDPDAHTPSWLTLEEFAAVLKGGCLPEYDAVLAALRALEARGKIARVVFWFDN